MQKQLAILIPTLPDRMDCYVSLLSELINQRAVAGLQNRIQILSLCDTQEMSVGEKRNWLMDMAYQSKYIQYLDDDDKVSNGFLLKMYEATLTDTDVITFRGEYHEAGVYNSDFIISSLLQTNSNLGNVLYRRPNHICAVKRDIAIQCKFPPISNAEDKAYSEAICKLIKTETHIPEKLYFYMFDKDKTLTQLQYRLK